MSITDEEITHGTRRAYRTIGCRCEICRRYNAERCLELKRKRMLTKEPPVHGLSGAHNYNCKCEVCRDAVARANRAWVESFDTHPERKQHARKVHASRVARIQRRTTDNAARNGYAWTGPDMEILLRTDLTLRDKAHILKRTYFATARMNRLVRKEPKFREVAGLPDLTRKVAGR